MLNDKIQKQEGGDSSTNYQGQVVTVYQGISYKDAKEIALDVFKSNFLELKNEAAVVAKQRAEEITETFLEKLNERSPAAINEFEKPALQDALFTAQKEYAKSGDKELGDLLVDILVDRANSPTRNMMQVVLDEALSTAPKLTIEQLDTLSLLFLLTHTRRLTINNLATFNDYIIKYISAFADNLTSERSSYNYIEYLGCGHVRAGDYWQLENNLLQTYKAIFQKGFSKEEFELEVGPVDEYGAFLIPCFHDVQKFQFNRINDKELNEAFDQANITEEMKGKLKAIYNKSTMALNEVRNYIISLDDRMKKVFDVWENSVFKKMELTSVGVAIAHANYRRKIGETMDLSIWIK